MQPVKDSDYEPKGTWGSIAGSQTYVTGSTTASKAVYYIYDVFGYSAPTLQGADRLASTGYLVAIPDLLEGQLGQIEWFTGTSEEDKRKAGEYMKMIQNVPFHLSNIDRTLEGLKKEYPSVQKWAGIGYCWGGKMISITSGSDSPWSVGIQSSPARVDAQDAEKITIPQLMLASMNEPADAVKAFDAALKTPHRVEIFSDQIHGFMSARADLKDPRVQEEYDRGYKIALDFLAEHL